MSDSGGAPAPLGAWLATDYEVVAELFSLMPTGVTVSDDDRLFVSFPRWGDDVPFTVAEIVEGKAVAYPDADFNALYQDAPGDGLVSVQSVIVDPVGHLWLLDTGSLAFAPWVENGPKLVEVDLATNQVVRVIRPSGAANTTTYLNDVRFDLSRGSGGYAYITDSQAEGALIVVDLASGDSWARLRGHETTHSSKDFRAIVQGIVREFDNGADGIAISPTGDRIYYSPLASRRLYSVSADALVDRSLSEEEVAATIVDHGDKGASDGLESDTDGTVYMTAYEHSAVVKVDQDGTWSTVLHAPALLWPDTLALASDGYLYVSVNQLPRAPVFNHGTDDRLPPFKIIRKRVSGKPIRLGHGTG